MLYSKSIIHDRLVSDGSITLKLHNLLHVATYLGSVHYSAVIVFDVFTASGRG